MKNVKIYEGFKPRADPLMNYQLCRAYFNFNGGILEVVEKILTEKLGTLPKKDLVYIREQRGKRNPLIDLPCTDYKATVEEILSAYVEQRFDKMVSEVLARKPNYPLTFRDIIERFM